MDQRFQSNDEIHVWRAELDLPEQDLAALAGLLSREEKDRAARFRFPRDASRFTAARGLLRTILGRYTGINPEALRFRYGPHGKPSLDRGSEPAGLQFNMSHSQGMAVYAIALNREIGVDVEWVDRRVDIEAVARFCFTLREQASIKALPDPRKQAQFFTIWTRKEAYVKARGEGLLRALTSIDTLQEGEGPLLIHDTPDSPDSDAASELDAFWIQDLHLGEGWAAALAVQGKPEKIICNSLVYPS